MKFFRGAEQILEPYSIVYSSRMLGLSDVGSLWNLLERALGLDEARIKEVRPRWSLGRHFETSVAQLNRKKVPQACLNVLLSRVSCPGMAFVLPSPLARRF
jgi:hypothetical protein